MKRNLLLLSLVLLAGFSSFAQTGNLSRIQLFTYGGLPVVDSAFSKPLVLINDSYISAYDPS